jgi:rare lipoprotein A
LSFPIGSQLLVTNLANGKSVIVTVNDRGPFIGGRVIDLERSAFLQIGSLSGGVLRVKVERIR